MDKDKGAAAFDEVRHRTVYEQFKHNGAAEISGSIVPELSSIRAIRLSAANRFGG